MPTQNTYSMPLPAKQQQPDYLKNILNTILGAQNAEAEAAFRREQLNMQQELTSAQAYNQRQQGGLFGQQSGQIADGRANKRIQQTQNRERLGMETPKSSLDLIKKAILGDGPSPAMPNPAASQQQNGNLQAIENALIPQRTQTQNALPGLSPPMSLHNTTAAQPEAQKQDYRTIADLSPLEFAGLQAAYAPEGSEGAYGLQALSYEPEATHDMLMRAQAGTGLQGTADTALTNDKQQRIDQRNQSEAARTRQAELAQQRIITDGATRVANINAAAQRYNTDQQVALQQQQMAMEAEQARAEAQRKSVPQLTDSQKGDLIERLARVENINRLGNEIIELMEEGDGLLNPDNRAKINQKHAMIEIEYGKLKGLGTLDAGMQLQIGKVIANPADFYLRDGKEAALFRQFLEDAKGDARTIQNLLYGTGQPMLSAVSQPRPGKVPPDIAGMTDFASEAELREAEKLGHVKAGDRVIINGSVAILG